MNWFNTLSSKNWRRVAMAAGALLMVAAQMAMAAPYIDPELQAIMRRDSAQPEPIKVIAMFENQVATEARIAPSPKYYRQNRAMLVENARRTRDTVSNFMRRFDGAKPAFKAEQLWFVNAMIVTTRTDQLQGLTRLPGLRSLLANKKVHLIKPVEGHAISRHQEGAKPYTYGLEKIGWPQLQTALPNATGEGVTVGILDTGIDEGHPDLKGKVVAFKDFVDNQEKPYDDNSHGTHVAGTIAGGNSSGTAIGVAPQAKLVIGKIFSADGSSTMDQILKGMQWAADPDGNPNTPDHPAVISNSWGGDNPSASTDPKDVVECQAVASWVQLGVVPVFAAGNSGSRAKTIELPAACPGALAVGATNEQDQIAGFSSRGPAVWKTGEIIKPDVSAPGVNVNSSVPGGKYASFSGTSMACPHVAGVVALVRQQAPALPVDQAIKAVMAGTVDLGNPGHDPNFGTGRVDLMKIMKPALQRH